MIRRQANSLRTGEFVDNAACRPDESQASQFVTCKFLVIFRAII